MDAVSLPPPSSPARSFPSFPAKFQRATWDAPPNNERERVCARTCVCERERERDCYCFYARQGQNGGILRASVKQLNITAIVNSLLSFVRNRYVRDLHQI